MTPIVSIGLGLLIGLSLGALGGGGSILTVPALVYALGESARSATTASLVIVGITSAVATLGHGRAGRVRWGAGFSFGVAGVVASFVGTALNARVDPHALLVSFAGLMLVAAIAMFAKTIGSGQGPGSPGPAVPPGDRGGPGEAGPRGPTATLIAPLTCAPAPSSTRVVPGVTPAVAVRVLLAGLVVGFLTGFLGVGGGFIIVPALVLTLRYDMPTAVGTSLLIISLNSGVALVARTGHQHFHWAVIVPFTLAAGVGSLGGKRMADRVSGVQLTRAFGVLLVLVAGYVLLRATSG